MLPVAMKLMESLDLSDLICHIEHLSNVIEHGEPTEDVLLEIDDTFVIHFQNEHFPRDFHQVRIHVAEVGHCEVY